MHRSVPTYFLFPGYGPLLPTTLPLVVSPMRCLLSPADFDCDVRCDYVMSFFFTPGYRTYVFVFIVPSLVHVSF